MYKDFWGSSALGVEKKKCDTRVNRVSDILFDRDRMKRQGGQEEARTRSELVRPSFIFQNSAPEEQRLFFLHGYYQQKLGLVTAATSLLCLVAPPSMSAAS